MNYLVVKNKGLIEPEDLYLIGSSTKREDDSKIGMFGSGWKFALAWLMRNECLPIILSGNERLSIDFNVVLHRNSPVKVITVNGKETSLTSEMGMKWSGWMAIREIVSNAIDEGGESINTVWNPMEFLGSDDETTIYIPLNTELANVLRNYDHYFSFERNPSYTNEHGNVYFKSEASDMVLYRKGIRCFDSQRQTRTDFDFTDIEINESRLTEDYHIRNGLRKLIRGIDSKEVLKNILDDNLLPYLPQEPNANIVDVLKELVSDGEVPTCPMMQGIGGIFLVNNPTLVIPNKWYSKLAELGIVDNPFSKLSDDGAPENFIRTDKRDISGVKYYLDGLNLNYNYLTGLFDGTVKVSGDNVYINDKSNDDDLELASHVLYGTSRSEFKRQMK